MWGWGWGGWAQHCYARFTVPLRTKIQGSYSITAIRRCNKGRQGFWPPTRMLPHTLTPKGPAASHILWASVLLKPIPGYPCPRKPWASALKRRKGESMFLYVGFQHIDSSQYPWSPGAPYAIWGNPSPLPVQMPSLGQLPRTTPRLGSTTFMHTDTYNHHRGRPGAAHPVFTSFLVPYS